MMKDMLTDNKIYNILVIEDNPGDFALVEEFLLEQTEEFILLQAKSLKEAKEILFTKVFKFDIILLDLSLPDKTGLPLIQEILELSCNTPVIVLTGHADFTFGVKSLSMGIADYILKDDLTPTILYKSILYSSERKRSMIALEESEKQYSELFHLSPQPMWVFELETLRFLDVNDAAIQHYGYTREDFLMMTINDISPTDEIYKMKQSMIDCSNKNKLCPQGVFVHRKRNGDFIQVDIQGNSIEFRGKKAKIILANDVTERLNYVKAIEAQNEKLREISWIQSHLVRAPVARILGLVQLINNVEDESERNKVLYYLTLSANELDGVIREITEKTMVDYATSGLTSELSIQYANYR